MICLKLLAVVSLTVNIKQKDTVTMMINETNCEEILRKHRRELHRIPELSRDLPKTKQYIVSVLQQLSCRMTFLCDSGVCAYFDKGRKETLAFRADMDALPVHEDNDCTYRSVHEGQMHACGHDGHMSMVLTLGQYVNTLDDMKYNVLLIFQPAEETLGGAKEICESGIMERYNVTKIFGIHMWPFAEAGKVASRPNALMPRSAEVNIDIYGKAAHGTAPYEGLDALYIGAEYLRRIYESHAKITGAVPRFPEGIGDLPVAGERYPEDKTIIHIGKMTSGYARNIVSDHTHLLGTVRAFSEKNFSLITGLLKDTLRDISEEYRCETAFSNSEGYPPVINNTDLYKEVLPVLRSLPCGYDELAEPLMISEDFSFYGYYAPSVFFLLGTGTGIPLHSVNFDFDEKVLVSGFELYRRLLSL